jgi:inner membrane transporter RhtA
MQSTISQTQAIDRAFPIYAPFLSLLINRSARHFRLLTGSIPPSSLVLLSSFAVQVSSVFAKVLFETIGPIGTAFLCKAIAALLLLAICRPQLRHHSFRDYLLAGLYGLVVAGMSFSIYKAIDHIPIGIASALEFTGPLGVAVLGSRRPLDLLWVVLAVIGVFLLSPFSGATLAPIGVVLALLSGCCWAGYIILSVPMGQIFPRGTGLAVGLGIATLMMLPSGIAESGSAILKPSILFLGLAAAILGTIVPYLMDFTALKRIPPRIFGILMSIEPAIAAIVGFIFLGESLSIRTLAAIVFITSAAIGVTWFGRREIP